MENNIIRVSIFILISSLAICSGYESYRKNSVIEDKNAKIINQENSIKLFKDSITSLNKYIKEKKIEKFTFVKERFSAFNSNIKDNTVKRFIKIVEHFKLDSTQEMFNLFIHEIILESGAKQYNNGELVKSYTGAIGIGQIMPNTAFSFLKRVVYSKEMYNLNCEDFSWINEDKGIYYPKSSETEKKVKKWLCNENNNLALWGAIMRYNLDKNNNNVFYALISYNSGVGGLSSFLNSGSNPSSHSYIQGILKKERISEDIISKTQKTS